MNKSRPKFWYQLPGNIMESIADSCELDYDSYEGSFQDSLHSILCNPEITSRNGEMIQEKYESLSNQELFDIVANNLISLQNQVGSLIEFRNKLKHEIP